MRQPDNNVGESADTYRAAKAAERIRVKLFAGGFTYSRDYRGFIDVWVWHILPISTEHLRKELEILFINSGMSIYSISTTRFGITATFSGLMP